MAIRPTLLVLRVDSLDLSNNTTVLFVGAICEYCFGPFSFESSSPKFVYTMVTGPKLRVCNENLIFLFLNQNICCEYSKELSR